MSEQITSLEDLAAVAEGTPAVVEILAPREPVRDELGRTYATGKRKDAVARVWIKPGSGNFRSFLKFFETVIKASNISQSFIYPL